MRSWEEKRRMCHLFLGLVVPRLWYLVNLIHDYHFSVHICISLRAYLVRISNQAWLYIHIMICGLHSRCSCCCCCCYHIKYRVDHKKGYTPPPRPTRWQEGEQCSSTTTRCSMYLWLNPTAQHDVCASTVHYSSYIRHHCVRTAQRPTPCGTSTLLSETQNARAGKHVCAPRACVSSNKSLITL